jgi:hypothetical protein
MTDIPKHSDTKSEDIELHSASIIVAALMSEVAFRPHETLDEPLKRTLSTRTVLHGEYRKMW